MGAESFYNKATGKDPQQAFNALRQQALYEHGHSGYTGTIAEKTSYIYIGQAETIREAHRIAMELVNECDTRIDDKWGPAGCIEITGEPHTYLFFGWASS